MAVNIFEQYGIKEVANVYFEALASDKKSDVYKGDIVLYLDSLKVSTIETSAESTDATGGWGNAKLITWDYGKNITVTLEDALMSLESLRFMLGGAIHKPEANKPVIIRHTEEVVAYPATVNSTPTVVIDAPISHVTGSAIYPAASEGRPIRLINLTKGWRTQIESGTMKEKENVVKFVNYEMFGDNNPQIPSAGDHIRIFWEEEIEDSSGSTDAVEVTISPDTFPGTYRVVGDTYIRNKDTGADEPFQFVINQAKVLSDVTITLQAEGDPSTFSMSLNVLRSKNDRGENEMMKLIRYNLTATNSGEQSGIESGSLNPSGGT